MKKLSQKKKKIYLNKAQAYLFQIAPRNLTVIGSRRSGKSEGILMPILLRNVQTMPRSNGAIVARSYKQALTRTLPATLHALSRLGYEENVHYYIGRHAPKSAGFPEPYIKPRNWDYVIHWYNGSINTIISQDIPFSANSLTTDYIIGDEARSLNEKKFNEEIVPANSGLHYFADNCWHTGITLVSDMPLNQGEEWLLKRIKDFDPQVLKVVESLIYEIYQINSAPNKQELYQQTRLKELNKDLSFFRSKLNMFYVLNILDNLEIVGTQYIDDMFRNLSPYLFLTQMLSFKVRNIEGSFYSALDRRKHYYIASNIELLNNFRKTDGSLDIHRIKEHKFNCSQDTDIDYSKPLYIAFDVNININWVVIGQPDYANNQLKVLNSLFVKAPAMLSDLIRLFVNYYSPLPKKHVIFYYDHTFLQGKNATNSESFRDTIIRLFQENNWYIEDVYIGQAERHDIKHKAINFALKGEKGLLPLFNEINNETLIKALELTKTKLTAKGWGKDKSMEKLPDTQDNPVEHRTDGTDAFDTLFIGCNNYPHYSQQSINLTTEFR